MTRVSLPTGVTHLDLDEPAPDIHITSGWKQSFTFSFADFLEIWLKIVTHLDGNPAGVSKHIFGISALQFLVVLISLLADI